MVLRDPAALAYAAAAVVFASLSVVTWRRRVHNPTVAAALTLVMAGSFWWSVADMVFEAALDPTVAAVANLAFFPGLGVTVAAFAILGFCIARPQWVPPRRVVVALAVEPLLITLLAATNPWHQLVYRGAGAAEMLGSAAWTHGPAFWLHTAYSYLVMGAGIALIGWSWLKAAPAFRLQRLALLLAALAPIAVNVVHLAVGFAFIPDPTPLGFAITGTVMTYVIFRQDLFTFTPVARALVIDQIGDAIVVVSPAGRVLDLNAAAVGLVRAVRPDVPRLVIGMPAVEVFGAQATSATGPDGSRTEIAVGLAGSRTEFQVHASPLLDRRDRALGTVYVARDVTEANALSRRLSAANAQLVRQVRTIEMLRADLAEQASRDPLTGLHNRRHLVERFGPMVAAAAAAGEPLAVVLIDVDNFKSINDRHGHLVGDEVLVALAQLTQAHALPGALVARWGGEEFFVALPGIDGARGLAFADDLRRRCEAEGVGARDRTIHCTLSGGVAAYPASGTTMNELFDAADVALYDAKDAGRNRVRLYATPGPAAQGLSRRESSYIPGGRADEGDHT